LLSTALLELWRRREGVRLRLSDYEWAGGVKGAVARIAEDAYGRLSPADRELTRALLPRLAGEGAGDALVRVRVPLDQVDEPSRRVISVLADDRLLILGEGGVEVAHEALLHEWPRLRSWLEDDAEGRRLRRHLRATAIEWEAGGRDAGELYRGARLASALEWAAVHDRELAPAERDFLAAGRTESQRAQRRVRLALAVMTVLLALVVAGGVVALEQRGNARDQAVHAAAQRLGAEALVEDDLDRSLLLAAQGNALDDSVQTRGNLLAALLRKPAAVGVVHGDGQRMIGLTLSPDGRTLAFLERDGTIRAIDTRTRRSVAPSYDASGFEWAADSRFTFEPLAYSPDGRQLVVGGTAPAVLDARRHALRTGLRLPADRFVMGVRYSPDGRTIYAVTAWIDTSLNPETGILRFDAANGRVLGRERVVSRRPLERVAALPTRDGSRVVVTRAASPVEVLDASTLAPLARLPLRATHAALAPDDRTLVAGSDDGSVRFADIASGEIRTASGRHAAPVSGAAFGVGGHVAVTTAGDGGAIVWDTARGRPAETLAGHAGRVAGLAISRDGRTLYTAGQDSRILIWDLDGRRRLGQPFATGGDAPDKGVGADLPAINPADDVVPFALRADGRLLVVGRADGRVGRLDPTTLRPLGAPFRATRRGPVLSMALSPRSGVLVVGGARGQLATYDTVSGRLIRQLRGSGGAVWALAISGDGRLLASGGLDGRVRFWDLSSGRPIGAPLNYDVDGVADLSLSRDGKRLVVSHFGGAEVVSVASRKRLVGLAGSDSVIDYARFTRDGRRIVGGSFEGWTQIWSAETGRPVTRRLGGHAGPVDWASVDPDGRTLASSSTDGTVRLYDLESQKPLGTPLAGVPNRPVAAEYTPDGAYLIAIFADGRAIRWDVRLSSWRRYACAAAGRSLTRAEWRDLLPDYKYAPGCRG
jgi:WD40 repeat protein